MEKIDIASIKRTFQNSLERKVYNLVINLVKEQVIDFTVLYLRRNKVSHNPEDLEGILNVFRIAMDDSLNKNLDNFMASTNQDLDKVIQEINPLATTDTNKK